MNIIKFCGLCVVLKVVSSSPVSQPIYQSPQQSLGGAAAQQVQYQQIPAEYLAQYQQLFTQQAREGPSVKEPEQNENPGAQQITYAQAPSQQVLQSAVDRQVGFKNWYWIKMSVKAGN